MNEEDTRKIAREEAQSIHDINSSADQFAVSQTPFHTHNGADSQKFPFKNLSDVPISYHGKASQVVKVNSTETGLTFATQSAGNPAGSNKQVQFNDSGAFGADAGLLYDKSSTTLEVSTINSINADMQITAADGGAASNGQNISLIAGNSIAGGTVGGNAFLQGGNGDGIWSGGNVELDAGTAGSTGTGGGVILNTGKGGASSGDGGLIDILAADAGGNGKGGGVSIASGNGVGAHGGGIILIQGGDGGASGNGSTIDIFAGNGGATTGSGGAVSAASGAATGGDNNGGNINLLPGVGHGTGHQGNVVVNGVIATTDNGGFLVIPKCAGAPTGTPSSGGSMVYDTTNNKLYVYNGGWKSVTLS